MENGGKQWYRSVIACSSFSVTREFSTGYKVRSPLNSSRKWLIQSRDSFERLSSHDQSRLLEFIGELACARASQQEEGLTKSEACSYIQCATQTNARGGQLEIPKRLPTDVQDLINAVIEILPHLQKLAHTRVAAMRAVRRLLAHTSNAEHLNMRVAVLGQWCLQAVHSSLRDLRIVAGYLVPSLLCFKLILTPLSQPNINGVPELTNCTRGYQE